MNKYGTVLDTYVRGINLISSANNGYYLFNAHGDVTQLANAAGTITKDYHYDAFGVETSPDEADANPFRYCGEYFDQETGSIYLRARYYNPATGRFMSEDPLHDSLNWYTYCEGNPVSFIDPSGLLKVMLDYIVEKNDGDFQVTKEYDGWAYLKIMMNGHTAIYSAELVNGHYIVDHELLMTSFGLTKEQAMLWPDVDKFHSELDAVMAFGYMFYDRAFRDQKEYGAAIDKDRNGKFSYGHISEALGSGRNKKASETPLRYASDGSSVATVHIHWDPTGMLTFSLADRQSAIGVLRDNYHLSFYLFNREGYLLYMYPDFDTAPLGTMSAEKTLFKAFDAGRLE